MQNAVVLSDYKLIKELFMDNASTGRVIDNPVLLEFSKGPYGVLNGVEHVWEQQRRFTLKTLKHLGFAKTSMEHMISDEIRSLLQWFGKFEDNHIPGTRIFTAPVVNSLWRMITGERCSWETNRPPILDAYEIFYKCAMRVSTNGLIFAPGLRHIMPNLMGWNAYCQSITRMHSLLQESVDQHKQTFDPNCLRDFIDYHLLECENKAKEESSDSGAFSNENLIAGLFDLFFAGSETTSSTLSWALLYLSNFPEVQVKCQAEIDKIIGECDPSLNYRPDMPFIEAFISETFRMSAVVPIGHPHEMLEDKHFKGYLLPKGTQIFYNIYGVHRDTVNWKNPETFMPERFLNDDGTKYERNNALITFSEGKRKCLGEHFARDTFFLFIVGILKEFTILPKNAGSKADMEPEFGMLVSPKPFEIILQKRIQ